ncbi:autophagy protein [Tilletia horrida]|uniref:Autophagy-related protein 18 n=1 Tax=Tilletia horrida TaxID=155126 RepID=A0AAN6GQI1_9BASI|nr:autophagy protein [Tilletia horrida]KAK0552490.1 autophagy protein [Tilletia horrida]
MSRLLGSSPSKAASELLAVNFNQDHSCVAVGTRHGYSISNCEPFGRVYNKKEGPIYIIEMLFCTSLVALVGTPDGTPTSSPRRLQIVNTKRNSQICSLTFPTTILGVKLNRRRLVVILEEAIYIYDISNMKLLHIIETSPNPNAICALSPSSDPCYLAYPSPIPSPTSPFSNPGQSGSNSEASSSSASQNAPGDVLIFDLMSLSVTNIVQAHKTPISALALNSTGTMLATASDKGTIIRVFSVPSAQKLFQFRRGTYPARIYNLSFNAVSTLLCASSDTDTVHIFKLTQSGGSAAGGRNGAGGRGAAPPALARVGSSADAGSETSSPPGSSNGSTAGGYEAFIDDKKKRGGLSGTLRRTSAMLSRNVAGSVGGYLPNSLAEIWEPQRDFAHLKLPSPGVSSLVAVSSTTPQVMVVTSEGYFYQYQIDFEHGGECELMKQYSLLNSADEDSAATAAALDGE